MGMVACSICLDSLKMILLYYEKCKQIIVCGCIAEWANNATYKPLSSSSELDIKMPAVISNCETFHITPKPVEFLIANPNFLSIFSRVL
jgi:hypothetical protein